MGYIDKLAIGVYGYIRFFENGIWDIGHPKGGRKMEKVNWAKVREELSRELFGRASEREELQNALLGRACRRLVDELFAKGNQKQKVVSDWPSSRERALKALEKRALGLGGVPKPLRQLGKLRKEGLIDDDQFLAMVKALGYEVMALQDGGFAVLEGGYEIARFKF